MRAFFFFALLALFLVSSVTAQSSSVCQGAPTHISGISTSVSLQGRNVSLTLDGTVDEQVTSGQIVVDVYYSGAKM